MINNERIFLIPRKFGLVLTVRAIGNHDLVRPKPLQHDKELDLCNWLATRQIRLSVKSLTMVSTSLNKRKKAKEAKKKAAYR
jgi:hypothetical protein